MATLVCTEPNGTARKPGSDWVSGRDADNADCACCFNALRHWKKVALANPRSRQNWLRLSPEVSWSRTACGQNSLPCRINGALGRRWATSKKLGIGSMRLTMPAMDYRGKMGVPGQLLNENR